MATTSASTGTGRGAAKVPFAGGRYLLSHRLGNGSFGDIFEGFDTVRHTRVAVKLEKKKVRYPQLEYESKVYRVLHQPPVGINELIPSDAALLRLAAGDLSPGDDERVTIPPPIVIGIPQIFYYDSEGDYNIMVMELCGPSLEDLFNYCHRRFSLKTVVMIAEQILYRVQYVHERGFVHRDIKPENFTFGCGRKAHLLYLIDFGLSKLYWDARRSAHIPFVEGKPLTGTARYCSANTHRGYEQSRRDDLESIGFLLVYFLKGSLPWQGIQAKDQQLKTIRIGEKKIATSLEDLCKGLPSEFLRFCQYCRELSFQQKPDYNYLRGLFRTVAQRYNYLCQPPSAEGAGAALNAKDLSSYAGSHGVTASTTTGTTTAVHDASMHAGAVPRSRHVGASGMAALMGAADSDVGHGCREPDPRRGYYDWCFDWFNKREAEVRAGIDTMRMARAVITDGSSNSIQPPSTNPAMGAYGAGNSNVSNPFRGPLGRTLGSPASPLNQQQQRRELAENARGAGHGSASSMEAVKVLGRPAVQCRTGGSKAADTDAAQAGSGGSGDVDVVRRI